MTKIIDTYTGYICECCLLSYHSAEPCDCKVYGHGLPDHALRPWHFSDITIEHDSESVHFGTSCLGCEDLVFAGTRYDVQIHVWE